MAHSSLTAIAERIQGRNDALRSELSTLDHLQSQLCNTQQLLQLEEVAHATSRKALLVSVQSSNEIELQTLQLKEDIHTIDNTIARLQKETSELHSKKITLSNQFQTDHAPIYANHILSTKLYILQLQTNLNAAQTKKRSREEKMRNLQENTERMRQDIEKMRLEHARLVEILNEMDEKADEDDEEMVALGMQIKTVLSKKASLRGVMNETSDLMKSATTNRETWESRLVERNLEY